MRKRKLFHSIVSGVDESSISAADRICNVMRLQERKELLKGSYRDRHFNAGSILLGFGVFESVGGGVNTWFRTGKLFPGPHLFSGAGIIFSNKL